MPVTEKAKGVPSMFSLKSGGLGKRRMEYDMTPLDEFSSKRSSDDPPSKPSPPGLCGLYNLGNVTPLKFRFINLNEWKYRKHLFHEFSSAMFKQFPTSPRILHNWPLPPRNQSRKPSGTQGTARRSIR